MYGLNDYGLRVNFSLVSFTYSGRNLSKPKPGLSLDLHSPPGLPCS